RTTVARTGWARAETRWTPRCGGTRWGAATCRSSGVPPGRTGGVAQSSTARSCLLASPDARRFPQEQLSMWRKPVFACRFSGLKDLLDVDIQHDRPGYYTD